MKKIKRLIYHILSLNKEFLASHWFVIPHFNKAQRKNILSKSDPVRYGSILLAIEQIKKENISGNIAECGVWKGALSKFIHTQLPDKNYFLFDTFEGFDIRDLGEEKDTRFNNTNINIVLNYIGGNKEKLIIKQGFFPETTKGMKEESFSLIILDFDKYDPTAAGLEYFYPLVVRGGFIFIHDYSSNESNFACSRAVDEFLKDKIEKPILIPDAWGSAIIRKL